MDNVGGGGGVGVGGGVGGWGGGGVGGWGGVGGGGGWFESLLAQIFSFGKYVRLTVCVCSACNRLDNSRKIKPINTKLGTFMYPCCGKAVILFGIDDVIRSNNKSKFWTTVTPSIFKLECQSKAQNILNQSLLAQIFSFGKYVRLTVCVCSACNRLDNSRKIKPINTKLGTFMYPCCGKAVILFGIDDVIRSNNKSKFWTTVTPSIFKLECQSKAQNIRNARGYLVGIFNFRYHFC